MELSHMLPVNVLTLELKDSLLKDEDPFVTLGALVHLKLLRLSNFFVGATLACKPGSFPQLEELSLENLQNLKKLTIMNGAFPCLKKLDIASCPCLQDLPHGLEFVSTLQQFEYFEMPAKFFKSAADSGWGDFEPDSPLSGSSHQESNWMLMRRSYPYEDHETEYVVGLDEDIKNLVKLLTDDGNQVYVLSIAGMGGCGKTTLAKKLYNHPNTKQHFDYMAWVFVSQKWSIRSIFSQILRKLRGPKETNKLHARLGVEELLDRLTNVLINKSFLIVLDDLWTREVLEQILLAVPRGSTNKRSKIITTSRNSGIFQFPSIQQHQYIHEPLPLSEEEGWALFKMIALNDQTRSSMDQFEPLGKIMLQICDGLPLAIVASAELLSKGGNTIEQGQQIYNIIKSRVMDYICTNMYGSLHDLLAMSYDDLRDDLKPCFLYFGVFPEKCEIPAGMLTRMWIAEDLVPVQEHNSPEDVAAHVLEELSQRFMIRVRRNFKGSIKVIQVHHMLHELCVKKAREVNFLQIYTPVSDSTSRDATAQAISPKAALHSRLTLPTDISNLTSLVVLTKSSILHSDYVSMESLNLELVHHFKLLKMLNLWGIKTSTGALPTEIGILVHLKYLGIRASNITELPTSVGELKNLLTLDYRDVADSASIPDVFWKLVLLRNLYLPTECKWNVEELHLSALKNLQILWGIKCDGGDWFSREMTELSATVKKLKVLVETENNLDTVFNCLSLTSCQLHSFHCEWTKATLRSVDPSFVDKQHLQKLVLDGTMNVDSLVFPSNLVVLELRNSRLREVNPVIAAGALAHLKILRMSNAFLGTASICELGSFPELEELYIDYFPDLDIWIIQKGAMKRLEKFVISRCDKLRTFPCGTSIQIKQSGLRVELDRNANPSVWPKQSLTDAVFLNNGKQKYWGESGGYQYENCVMLYEKDLLTNTIVNKANVDSGFNPSQIHVVRTVAFNERTISSIVRPVSGYTNSGKFSMEVLSPGVMYEVQYVFKLGFIEEKKARSKLMFSSTSEQRDHDLSNLQPARGWTVLTIGEFICPQTG